jgi:hypothetical protein
MADVNLVSKGTCGAFWSFRDIKHAILRVRAYHRAGADRALQGPYVQESDGITQKELMTRIFYTKKR